MRNVEKKRPEREETAPDRDLGRALSEGLNLPLSALRASMESLTQELARGGVGPLLIDGVLREVDRIGRNVQDLLDYTTPPVVRPLRCTLEEIVTSARRQLAAAHRNRVIVAHERAGATIVVDGPLLSACLRRLLENALEASSELVLVVTRQEKGKTSIAVIDDGQEGLDLDWAERGAFRTTKPNHLGLGIALTERDVASMRGELEFFATPSGGKLARLIVPDSTEEPR